MVEHFDEVHAARGEGVRWKQLAERFGYSSKKSIYGAYAQVCRIMGVEPNQTRRVSFGGRRTLQVDKKTFIEVHAQSKLSGHSMGRVLMIAWAYYKEHAIGSEDTSR